MKKSLLLLSAVALLSTGCEEEPVDSEKPVITITNPSNEQVLKQGDTFQISGSITDNIELKEFKIDIHEGDGHSHGNKWESADSLFVAWDHEVVKSISGTSATIDETVTIPTDADTAEYHILIDATDKSGNQAVQIQVNIDVELQ